MLTRLAATLFAIKVSLFAAADISAPWRAALGEDHASAAAGFDALQLARSEDPQVAVARAASLLVRQPQTLSNISEARRILAGQVQGAGDTAILAAYLLARVDQDHMEPPRPEAARAAYVALRAAHPGHALADQAAVQLALLDANNPALPVAERVDRIEVLLDETTLPQALRELRYLLATLEWRHRRNADAAIAHLLAGRAIGYEKAFRDSEVDLMIANLALQAGRTALAVEHYRAFLAAAPRDDRTGTVRNTLKRLESAHDLASASHE